MRIASINLRSGLGNPARRHLLESWLSGHSVDVLLAQDAWSARRADPPPPPAGFSSIEGTSLVHALVTERWRGRCRGQVIGEKWLRVELPDLVAHVVYLDSTSRRSIRAGELTAIRARLVDEAASRVVVVGDFNLAPNDVDGRFGDKVSRWNSETDRAPFRRLLADAGLVDIGAHHADHAFTFERMSHGLTSSFRCDLVLASRSLAPELTLSYDHATRDGVGQFTDHSGLILDATSIPT